MPTGNTDGQFHQLNVQADIADSEAGSAKIRDLPYYFRSTGWVDGGIYYEPETSGNGYGAWWSSTVGTIENATFLGVDSENVIPTNTIGRYYGLSLRCITTPTS